MTALHPDVASILSQALFAHATSPFKMVGMMGFMMWMSGSQLHIFSIMTTLSGVYQPLSAILSSGSGRRPCLARTLFQECSVPAPLTNGPGPGRSVVCIA